MNKLFLAIFAVVGFSMTCVEAFQKTDIKVRTPGTIDSQRNIQVGQNAQGDVVSDLDLSREIDQRLSSRVKSNQSLSGSLGFGL